MHPKQRPTPKEVQPNVAQSGLNAGNDGSVGTATPTHPTEHPIDLRVAEPHLHAAQVPPPDSTATMVGGQYQPPTSIYPVVPQTSANSAPTTVATDQAMEAPPGNVQRKRLTVKDLLNSPPSEPASLPDAGK